MDQKQTWNSCSLPHSGHGWIDTAVVLHCCLALLRGMKLFATTEELAQEKKDK